MQVWALLESDWNFSSLGLQLKHDPYIESATLLPPPHCAGLNKEMYNIFSKSTNPFFSPQCRLVKQQQELNLLRDSLSSKLAVVCGELDDLKSSARPSHPLPHPMFVDMSLQILWNWQTQKQALLSPLTPRKCRLSPPISMVLEQVLSTLIQPLTEGSILWFWSRWTGIRYSKARQTEVWPWWYNHDNSKIELHTVRDHFRLGKYHQDSSHPRPILNRSF